MKPFSLAGLFGFALLLSGCGDEPQPAPPRPVLTVTVKTLKNDDLGRFAGSIQARYERARLPHQRTDRLAPVRCR